MVSLGAMVENAAAALLVMADGMQCSRSMPLNACFTNILNGHAPPHFSLSAPSQVAVYTAYHMRLTTYSHIMCIDMPSCMMVLAIAGLVQ